MRAIPFHSRRTSAPEGGFTLIEMVVTISLLMVVVAAILGVFESVQRSSAFVQERSETLDTMRLALDQMTKEIRQARVVQPASTASRIEMTTYLLGIEKSIVYEVVGEELRRSVNGATAVVMQDNVTSPSLFSYTSDPGGTIQVVALALSVHPLRRPNTTVVLSSEVRVRNRSDVP